VLAVLLFVRGGGAMVLSADGVRRPGRPSRAHLPSAALSDAGPHRSRALIPRRLLLQLHRVAVLGFVTIYQARPYLSSRHDYPTAKRTINEVKTYFGRPAPPPPALLAPRRRIWRWGGGQAVCGESPLHDESVLSRVLILVLALSPSAVRGSPCTPGWRLPCARSSVCSTVLGLGSC